MATYSIKWLKNLLGTKFFPITHVKAVRDDNNTNLETLLSGKQQTLVSGSNIKTINGESVLGSGNISVSGGGGGGDVNVIESISVNNTPQAVDANKNVNITVPSKVSDLSNDSGFITGYTETDPVFSASAAADISDTDIDNWNSKTSNIGTITGITMNGSSKGTSGVVNLGTVITAHQDISGKADKSATVSSVDYNTTSKKITKTINGTTTDVVTAAKIVTDGGGITTETDPTVPSWAKESSKPSYTASEVGAVPTTRTVNGKALSADITLSASDVSALPSSTAIPSKTSDLTNDSGFLTSSDISGVYKYKGSKTNYSNLPTTGNVTGDVWNVVNAYGDYPAGTNFAWTGSAWDALGGAVDLSGYVPTSRTVNGKALSSNISLSASDVSALPSSTYIPTKTSDLTNDSDFITSADIPEGAAASSTTPKMDGTAAVGTETRFARGDHRHPSDTSKQDVISDLATIRSNASAGAAKVSNVQADWNASTGLAVILNKPTIPAEVTESTVAGWGFTKNTGTYSKPSTGIPKTDLASAVQTSLGLADTALQSYTETDPVFMASAAHGISSTDISNWNAKGTYSKPSGGIPKTDLASAVQTSLGKADTALQSYTETDPVFAASVAADITSSDINNWNSKTSNIGTITGINMNGASKGTSGVVDLGTVITAHQDISGKADKATTLAGYGITDAYTKEGNDVRHYALYGGTNLNPSSSNTVDLDNLNRVGNYYCASDSASQYVSNKPISIEQAFRVWISSTIGESESYLRQRFQARSQMMVYERVAGVGSGSVQPSDWSDWYLVQDNLGSYALASSLDNYLPLSGGTITLNTVDGLTINKSTNAASMIRFTNGNTLLGYLGFYGTDAPACNVGGNYYVLLHTGNFVAGTDYQTPIPANTYQPYSADGYLSLLGGVIANKSSINPFLVYGNGRAYIGFGDANANQRYGMIAMRALNGNLLRVTNGYAEYMIHDDGNYSGGSGSDARLKENVTALKQEDAKDVLSKLNPVEFDWNEKAKEIDKRKIEQPHDVGFIAQDVEKIVPSAVTADYAGDYLRLDTSKLITYLVKGWQEHEKEIAELKEEIAELRNMIK